MAKRREAYRVFVSSTYLDNRERRGIVEEAILHAGMVPVGMERFSASTQPTVEECARLAREADLLVVIVAHRYGWEPAGRDRSITEIEYDANAQRLVFLLDPSVKVSLDEFDAGPERWEKQKKLGLFKERIPKDQMPTPFTDELLGIKVVQSLHDWKARRAPEGVGAAEAPADLPQPAIERYLHDVGAVHNAVRLIGFETKVRIPLTLDDLYVPLRVRLDRRTQGDAAFGNAEEAERGLGEAYEDVEFRLSDALWRVHVRGGRRGVVILGDPGSGKTTLLKHLLVSVVQHGPESLGLPVGMVPVFVPVRLASGEGPTLGAVIDAALDEVGVEHLPGFGARLAARGNLLLLFDGLDEVADEGARERVSAWVAKLLRGRSDCRAVVTCRYAGYDAKSRLDEQFLELHVRPLEPERAQQFIERWYRTVESLSQTDPAKAELVAKRQAGELVDALSKSEFRANARVAALTRSPLLLTAICLVHRDRGRLPVRRAELYDECVNVLLERWREAKGLKAPMEAALARQVLQPVAYWMHSEEQRTRAPEDALVDVVTPALARVRWQKGDARTFLRAIRDESGLLTGWGGGSYGFMHLGFQEYLAARDVFARALDAGDPVSELAARFGSSWWQEVALLLLALKDASLFDPYMRAVVRTAAFLEHPERVAECLANALAPSPTPFVEVLRQAHPGESDLERRQLAAFTVLQAHFRDALAQSKSILGAHPLREVRDWFRTERRVVVKAARGEYELVEIPGGSFDMGSPDAEEGRFSDEGPIHRVRVPTFLLGRAPVTNEEYGRFLSANPARSVPKYWGDANYSQPRQPVVGVSWNDALAYCAWADLRLPSEAEWEYACRAGTTSRYWSGDHETDVARVGWYGGNSGGRLHTVGEKPASPWDLLDMHGNVYEWCADKWNGNYDGAPNVGRASMKGDSGVHVIRGGSWGSSARYVRSAVRGMFGPGVRNLFLGFRPAKTVTAH